MFTASSLLALAAIPVALLQLLLALFSFLPRTRLNRLTDVPTPTQPRLPKLSVIVPACNEVDTLEPALASLRAQTYPQLEVILVDDRSTDGTGVLIDHLARQDLRIQALHIDVLPSGWLGKNHALDRGFRASTGELVLFTDADIHFAPGALEKAISVFEAEGLDFMALMPKMHASSLLLQAMLIAFGVTYVISTRAYDVGREGSNAVAGVGAFNLVRRTKLMASEGFDWIRMEISDDVGLALVLHRAGARARFYIADDLLSVIWYPSVAAMVQGLEKNMFAVFGRFNLWLTGLKLTFMLVGMFVPLIAIAMGSFPLQVIALIGLLAASVSHLRAGRSAGFGILPCCLAPFSYAILCWAILRSTIRCMARGGVDWRGTVYPLEELRRGQRVKL